MRGHYKWYPPCQKNMYAAARLNSETGRFISSTAQIQRQPNGGDCLRTAIYVYLLVMCIR